MSWTTKHEEEEEKAYQNWVEHDRRPKMPDISMCVNHDCPLAKDCYRHEATPGDWQSYANFEGGENCRGYWAMEEKDD